LAFRTIAEASEELNVPAHVLRFWEGKFTQIRPLKRAGGRRHYRPDDMALLRGIRALLQDDGYQLKGVQKILRDQGVAWVRERGRVDEDAPFGLDATDQSNPMHFEPQDLPSFSSNVRSHAESGPLFAALDRADSAAELSDASRALLRKVLSKLEATRQHLEQATRVS
jgi:DNA-binding transcriptional MerR regulator